MLVVLLSIAPVFALIVLGHVLRRRGIPSAEFWNINDKLVYWVLFPALLFTKTSTLSLSGALLGDYALVILGGFAAATVFSLAAGSRAGRTPDGGAFPPGRGSLQSAIMTTEQKSAAAAPRRKEPVVLLLAVLADQGIEVTGRFSFKDMNAIFIRDPDRNVIELDEYPGDDPASRLIAPGEEIEAYKAHP